MLVYKIKLIKDDKFYYVNDKQKQTIDAAIAKKTSGLIAIGNDQIRLNSIESIKRVEIDRADLPSYFECDKSDNNENFKNLPTENVILDTNGKLLSRISKLAIEKTHNPYMMAIAHYTGDVATRQYYLSSKDIKRLVYMKYDPKYKTYVVKKIWNYGVAQW